MYLYNFYSSIYLLHKPTQLKMNLTLYAKCIVDLQIYFVSPCIFLIHSNGFNGNY